MDWTIVAAIAAVVGAGISWWQASIAKSQVDEAKEQAQAAKDQAAAALDSVNEAKAANELSRMERFAGANQLFVAPHGDNAFIVSNPMSKSIRHLAVECGGMANRTAYFRFLNPNEKERLVLDKKAEFLDSVFLEWVNNDETRGSQRISSYDIWDHIERR